MIRVTDVAKITGLGTQQVRVLARRGDIPSAVQYAAKGGWYFDREIVLEWKESRTRKPSDNFKNIDFQRSYRLSLPKGELDRQLDELFKIKR